MSDAIHSHSLSFDANRCAQFLVGTEGSPPRTQLMQALACGLAPSIARRALDLGCGPGREVVALLHAGFDVVAVDPYAEMLERTRRFVESQAPEAMPRVQLVQAALEGFAPSLAANSFGLVHAGFVLPFVYRASFGQSFEHLRNSIIEGGLFVGQFFGPDDEFIRESTHDAMTSHTADEVTQLFDGFDVINREEVNREGKVGRGVTKWWHVHHVIARKRDRATAAIGA